MSSPNSAYDEDLEEALAMSLAESSTGPAPPAAYDDNDNSAYDEQIRRAIALSLSQDTPNNDTEPFPGSQADSVMGLQAAASTAKPSINAPTKEATKPTGLAGLDRKAMEQERLARMGKRKRSPSPERPLKQVVRSTAPKPAASQLATNGLQYPQGTIKRTWATKHPRSNDITIGEVLQASTLNIAVLSAFQFESEWLFNKHLDPRKVKQIWIFSAKGEDVRKKVQDEAEAARTPNLKLIFPPLPGQTLNMHGKLMLLFHPDYLRVVVPTANMIKEDWGETGNAWQPGVMENTVFLIDLPRRPDGERAKEQDTKFGQELVRYLRAQEVTENVIDGLLKFDFAATAGFGFVHSIAGTTSGPERSGTGLGSLAKAIRSLELDDVDRLEIDYATSSLGALKEAFLKQVYLAACGLPPLSDAADHVKVLDRIRIYFPTKETVTSSIGGPDCGGIITLNRTFYDAPTFPRRCLRDHLSTRAGLLSHNKLLFARGRKKDGTPVAWAYIGSANLSEAAWGMQKLLKSGKEGSSLMRNWECGVVVPVPLERLKRADAGLADGQRAEGAIPPMSVFAGIVDVPFEHPGPEYSGKEPWIYRSY